MKEEEETVKAEAYAEPAAPVIKDAFEAAHEAFFANGGEKPQASESPALTQGKSGAAKK